MNNRNSYIFMNSWVVHWATAALTVAILITSFLPLFAPGSRAGWMSLHLSLGWSLLLITIVRFSIALVQRPAWRLLHRARQVPAVVTLATLLGCAALGTLLFRPSPLGGKSYLFGVIPAPSLHWLDHGSLLWVLPLHRYRAYGLLGILGIHVLLAFIPHRKAGPLPIRWLWRGSRVSQY